MASIDKQRTGPLAGVRVIDLTSMISGPGATAILADQGADVVKIEPLSGDLLRWVGPNEGGFTPSFIHNNRGKRSIALNLRSPDGLATAKELVRGADVFIQNFRTGVVDRMGLSYEVVKEINPKIVYVSVSGFGDTGPWAKRRVYDPLIQAMSGLAHLQRNSASEPPQLVRAIIPDLTMGFAAAQAIAAALYARERTQQGQHVSLSMFDVMLSLLWPMTMAEHTYIDWDDGGYERPAWNNIYQTADGYICAVALSDDEWAGMCRALVLERLLNDPRFATTADRMRHFGDCYDAVAEVIRRQPNAELLDRLNAEDVPCAPVLTPAEILTHPQTLANGIVAEFEHSVIGRVRQAGPWARFSETPASIRGSAPLLGEHSRQILMEAGLRPDQIARLIEAGIILDSLPGAAPAK